MCEFFKLNNVDSEQICYRAVNRKNRSLFRNIICFPRYLISTLKTRFFEKIKKDAYARIKRRIQAVRAFNLSIPHSSEVYTPQMIGASENNYTAFVVGSDQVWHPDTFCKAFSLEFVHNKKKFSYAASMACEFIPDRCVKNFYNGLQGYSMLSVRETKAKELLEQIGLKNISVVVDPVFLLSKEKWLKMASQRMIKEPYVFCYFLGGNNKARKLAKEYAQSKGMKIATIPYLTNYYRSCDENFGDYMLSDVSPNNFLSLICNAEYIFTDSFHATAFSIIFNKQFFVCDRENETLMSSRIDEVIHLVNRADRYLKKDSDYQLDYLASVENIEYDQKIPELKVAMQHSLNYFQNMIDRIME